MLLALPAAGGPDVTTFSGGLITWTNDNTNLFYTVEFRPNLTGTVDWAGSYRPLQDIKTSRHVVTTAVGGVCYRVVGTTTARYLRVFSSGSAAVGAGYYEATNLAAVDSDLVTGNVRAGVNIFGVAGKSTVVETITGDATTNDLLSGKIAWVDGLAVVGAAPPAAMPATGQTIQYTPGDDGNYEAGVAWPSPRFTTGTGTSSNCVTDHLTGLMWLRNPNTISVRTWSNAASTCVTLTGADGRGGYGDWRLPNRAELLSLVDLGTHTPALPSGHPFLINIGYYWTGSTFIQDTTEAWYVEMAYGISQNYAKSSSYYVWPVRGGRP